MVPSLQLATLTGFLFANLLTRAFAQSVDPIVIKGSKFFYKTNGTEFYVKGIAYQQDFTSDTAGASDGFVDVLADPDGCRRDIPYLTELSTNLIRVYAIDPTLDHSECMNMMANAGIYVLADLGAPNNSIDSNDPSWDTTLYNRYTSVVDSLANYTNLFGFFAGNEIVTQPNVTNSAPFAKAAVRDTKSYIKSRNYRPIGVGYATSDNQYIREPLADYMNCGDQDEAVDFWGYNVYSWCGDSNFNESGYDVRVQQFSNYSVPVFFAEYGCNTVKPRMFTETPVLFGPLMDGVFSGGIVYLYFEEVNDFGLVNVSGNSVSTLVDFNNLKTQIATVSPTIVQEATYSPTNSPQACPTANGNFSAANSPLPPPPDTELCECMYNSLGCVVSPSVDLSGYGDLFDYVCGQQNPALCAGIVRNGTTGTYGQFGMCNSTQQLAYVLNEYYVSRKSSATACSFSGSAVTRAAASATGQCAAQLSSANSAAGVSGSGGPAASPSKGGASVNTIFGLDFGVVLAGVIAQVGVISGVGMILL